MKPEIQQMYQAYMEALREHYPKVLRRHDRVEYQGVQLQLSDCSSEVTHRLFDMYLSAALRHEFSRVTHLPITVITLGLGTTTMTEVVIHQRPVRHPHEGLAVLQALHQHHNERVTARPEFLTEDGLAKFSTLGGALRYNALVKKATVLERLLGDPPTEENPVVQLRSTIDWQGVIMHLIDMAVQLYGTNLRGRWLWHLWCTSRHNTLTWRESTGVNEMLYRLSEWPEGSEGTGTVFLWALWKRLTCIDFVNHVEYLRDADLVAAMQGRAEPTDNPFDLPGLPMAWLSAREREEEQKFFHGTYMGQTWTE